jgi:hypothetical protein
MSFDLADTKGHIQSLITDGAVTIVGSGLSAAAGLPTMSQLADLLLTTLPLDEALKDEWEPIAERVRTLDLESALDPIDADSPVLAEVIQTVATHVGQSDRRVIADVVLGKTTLPFTGLVKRLRRVGSRIVVITTNYDRLLEAAIERAGLTIDSSFTGAHLGCFDPKTSREAFLSLPRSSGRRAPVVRQHVALYKPHGSLDWYSVDESPVRSLIDLDAPRLIVTPGTSKHVRGYELPFDHHRDRGNTAIDVAQSLLFIGYGFNDGHLQTHLARKLREGTPALLIARVLTDNAKAQLGDTPHVLALEKTPESSADQPSTTAHWRGDIQRFDGVDLWTLDHLVREVLP